jgi:NAD(P)H-dependent flavin oxidoreductase YrpB (nitropropane dioxygenase family)
MKRAGERSAAQMALAANTPQLLKAGLVDGDTEAGVLAAGQVVGVLRDVPTCEELIDRIVDEAVVALRGASSRVVEQHPALRPGGGSDRAVSD